MSPDTLLIIETKLMAAGYSRAAQQARKIIAVQQFLSQLFRARLHGDLHFIKAILNAALERKQQSIADGRDEDEDGALVDVLRNCILCKLDGENDRLVFHAMLVDVWGMDVGRSHPQEWAVKFGHEVKRITSERNLTPSDGFVQNIIDLRQLLMVHHSVAIVGAPSSKSQCWKTLAASWRVTENISYYDINPKAIAVDELFGTINLATREWKDGLLTCLLRELMNGAPPGPQWIILDVSGSAT